MLRIHQILQEVVEHQRKHKHGQQRSWLPDNWDVNLEDSEMEILDEYALALMEINVDLSNIYLQNMLEGYFFNIEAACQITLQYAKVGHFDTSDEMHPTNFFIKALCESWKPRY